MRQSRLRVSSHDDLTAGIIIASTGDGILRTFAETPLRRMSVRGISIPGRRTHQRNFRTLPEHFVDLHTCAACRGSMQLQQLRIGFDLRAECCCSSRSSVRISARRSCRALTPTSLSDTAPGSAPKRSSHTAMRASSSSSLLIRSALSDGFTVAPFSASRTRQSEARYSMLL